ncbi:indolepyruvate ferredoxin oxidoreductase subunit alpha [Desulfovermiculus halophilus]|jgi:indolepyruvate ferredoxin oxidoreductase alpha subunit|uniref:indolepyruvate ferredoxin oxidoreductase subunit alpha n=1 Tax=Desulfovermiculus halophilus TaxID=339722 RepID=UPI000487841F|nr:indolepyruvate ferredoxin oxidoreductase subunit alpha [Desulfovermiculus halophilus]
MSHSLLSAEPGSTHLLLGNEAVVRGALEAGVGCVTCYPGTPSSEAPDTFFSLAPEADYYFEYSVNEKVALEVGGGAALGGVPALVTMKHVGVNVAADPLMSLAYIGTPGGLVLLSADDPGCHSSQNEQDNRYYARLAGLPCFEPASAQEAKDMTRDALLLSAKWEQPVLLRTTTRVNHLRGPVTFGPLRGAQTRGTFVKNPSRFVPLPAIARQRHPALLHNLSSIQEEIGQSSWTRHSGQGSQGIIASGISRAYLHDALADMDLQESFRILELGITYPFPEQAVLDLLHSVDSVLILEELEPMLEDQVRLVCQKHGLQVLVQGKDENLTQLGEYSTQSVRQALLRFQGQAPEEPDLCSTREGLPGRPPNLCPGCSHRSMYYAVRQVFGDTAIYSTDIGCYTLGFLPPLRAADFLFCMGSSVSGGSGMAQATGQPVVAYIGDSTFFHSGITGLINAIHNRHNLLLVVLDNSTTAMTGHQPHPGVDQTRHGPNPAQVDIEQVIRGCGVQEVSTVRPSNLKKTLDILKDYKEKDGVRVIIAKEPCVLFARRTLGRKNPQTAYVAEQTDDVRRCLEELACPAFYVQDGEIQIDENQCSGCMLCVQIAPSIKARKRS